MNQDIQYLVELLPLYIPIGIIGAWRWSVWLFQKIQLRKYHPLPATSETRSLRLSIVTPVYNENPLLFQSALESWKQNDPYEIIAVIDSTDSSCISAFKTFQRTFPNAILNITNTPGKRPALAFGSRLARGDIIALVDSDTVWDSNIRDSLLAPFIDPQVGGVSCRQAVLHPRTAAEKLFNIRLSLRYLHEYPYLMAMGDALTCLSGRTAVYRKVALLPVLDSMLGETFLGKKCISGEDKRLTSLIMKQGWKVRFQQNATVRTEGMPALGEFFRQNLRWARNSWRTDLRLIFSAWTWKYEPFFAYHLIDRMVQPFTLLLGPIFFFISLYFNNTLAAGILLVWLLTSRTIKLFPHLWERPLDLSMVPLFTLSQYYLAVLKIYALLSLDFQSWITRWHNNRLKRGFFELLPSQIATATIVLGIFYLAFYSAQSVVLATNEKSERVPIPYTDDFSPLGIENEESEFWKKREENAFATYQSRPGETPASVMRKFNIPLDKQGALFPKNFSYSILLPNTVAKISVEDLKHSFVPNITSLNTAFPLITYRPAENMIHIKGSGSVVKLSDITRALPRGQTHLEETAPKEWILRSKLYISEDVILILDGEEVTELKLLSTPREYTYIRSQHGGILINKTKITSWDETQNAPDTDVNDGRAFIVAYASGRLDVLDSDIGYLGFPLDVAKRLQDFGGNYGISWKLQNGTYGKYVMTGNIIGNRIHDNYFGIYTYGASGMLIQGNEIFNNQQYGIDPHDDSNNLIIEHNYVHHNGNHGIIGSKRVVYSTIRNNRSISNRLHGIMLDRDTNYNVVEQNIASENINGVALSSSHHNLIRHNTLTDNRFGIRSNNSSSYNIFWENIIKNNVKGIYIYGKSIRNIVKDNTITDNVEGVYLREARSNAVINSLHENENRLNLKLDEYARFTNFIQEIR